MPFAPSPTHPPEKRLDVVEERVGVVVGGGGRGAEFHSAKFGVPNSSPFAPRGTILCAHSEVICTHLHMYEEEDNFQRLTSRPEIDTIDLSF